MSSKVKFLIGGLVVVVVIGALIATSFSGSTSDYLTIAQVKALGPEQNRDSRVAGEIVPDSVQWNTEDLHLTFEIEDETGTLPISYHGPAAGHAGGRRGGGGDRQVRPGSPTVRGRGAVDEVPVQV